MGIIAIKDHLSYIGLKFIDLSTCDLFPNQIQSAKTPGEVPVLLWHVEPSDHHTREC
jgi:hypothetical protein